MVLHLGHDNQSIYRGKNHIFSLFLYLNKEYELVDNLKDKHTDAISSVVFVYNKQKRKWFAWSSSFDRSVCVWLLDTSNTDNPLTHDELQKAPSKPRNGGTWSRTRPTKPNRLSVTNDIRRVNKCVDVFNRVLVVFEKNFFIGSDTRGIE